jgi:hypothetical protein
MPNQLLQRLQNQLNNKTPLNLIFPEQINFEITEEHDKSYEKSFILSSVILSALLVGITYFNYNKSFEIQALNSNIINMKASENISIEELESRISTLNKIKEIKNSRIFIQDFINFLNGISKIQNTQILEVKYSINNKSIEYDLVINSFNQEFEKQISNLISNNLLPTSITKEGESTIENTNLKQYKFKGNYGLQ